MAKRVLIHIGGSYLQLHSIRWGKELGLHVIVTDQNANAPGAEIADRFVNISGTDITSLLELAREVTRKHQLVGIYSSNDFGLQAVATVGQVFGLPHCTPKATRRVLHKSDAQRIWSEHSLPVPAGIKTDSVKKAYEFTREIGLPVILKPTDSSGSRGVLSVWKERDIEVAFSAAQTFSEEVLVQKLLKGRHIDVNGLFVHGRFIRCGTMDRFFSAPPYHYPVWGYQPSTIGEQEEDAIYGLVEKAARVLGVDQGPVKADIIWSEEGPVLLEMAPRFHGDNVTSFLTPFATGSNPIKAYFAALAGQSDISEYLLRPKQANTGGWNGIFPSPGILRQVRGLKQASNVPGVLDVFVKVTPGMEIRSHQDNTTLAGFIWAVTESPEKVRHVLDEASRLLVIETEPRQ